MQPREFFPKMPDQVFDEWIGPIIKARGWPFSSIDDDMLSTKWRYIFGLDHTLKDWYKCKWELININLYTSQWQELTLTTVRDVIINCTKGIPTSTANVENTKDRFWACASFYKEHGTIPSPIVVRRFGEGFRIIDGNHRLASIFHIGLTEGLIIPAWVANIKTKTIT